MMVSTTRESFKEAGSIVDLYKSVRARTMQIVAPLEIEDYVIQTADFMSPPRWHIGHTSWFFETLLHAHQPGYKVYSNDYLFYFNSYYEGFGARIERPKRGTKSRPTVRATVAYRNHVDEQMLRFLESLDNHPNAKTVLSLVRLGLEHEMQHQELLVYDIKHLLCDQFDVAIQLAPSSTVKVEGMSEIEGGLIWLGYESGGGNLPTRSFCRILLSIRLWSATESFSNSCATGVIRILAGGFLKVGRLSIRNNGGRPFIGNCTTRNG
jgi:DinB family protein